MNDIIAIKQLYLRQYLSINQRFAVESYHKYIPKGYILLRRKIFRNKAYIHAIDANNAIYATCRDYYKKIAFE